MSKKEKKKSLAEQENRENLKQQEPEAAYEMGYKKGQRLRGFLEILVGVLILCVGLWLWSRTWGTMLLFTNATIGRLARYYWIVLIIAVILLIVGLLTMRKVRIEKKPEVIKEEGKIEDKKERKIEDKKGSKVEDKKEGGDNTSAKHETAEDGERQIASAAEKADDREEQIPSEAENAVASDQAAAIPEEQKAEVPSSEVPKMSDNKCPGCGKEKKIGAAFCVYCGYKF